MKKQYEQNIISVAKEFSKFPGGRYVTDGPNSGERFREEILAPALVSGDDVFTIDLDGTVGFGSSFLEEAFGGLVRVHNLTRETMDRLIFKSKNQTLVKIINEYINEAIERKVPGYYQPLNK